jgi:hypothetical protein
MNQTFLQAQTEDRRLSILILLANSPAYSANEYLLQSALDGFGHVVGMDRLKADIAWLAEQELVTPDSAGGVQTPKLTSRGLDVAQGRVTHPGVKRPRPS